MNIGVLGAGAIGSVFGGLLAEAGHSVSLIGRPSHMTEIEKNGLLIEGIWGTHHIRRLRCFTDMQTMCSSQEQPFDCVFVSVKSYDTASAIAQLTSSCTGHDPAVVSLQNGLGNLEIIQRAAGADRVVGGRVIFGVEFCRPGCVTVTVEAGKTVLGALSSHMHPGFTERLAEVLSSAGIAAETTDDIYRALWGKVLYNCSLNGLATLADTHYGELLTDSGTRQIMACIIDELFQVARACSVTLDWTAPDEYREVLFSDLIPKTFHHHPSMLQDIRRGKKTEIDALNGAVVELGRLRGIALPYNSTVTALIKACEARSSAAG